MGVGCSNKNQATITVSGDSISYEITGLEEGNRYTITVNASNAAGNGSASNAVTAMTQEIGEELILSMFVLHCHVIPPQLPLLLLPQLQRLLSLPIVSLSSGRRCLVLTEMER